MREKKREKRKNGVRIDLFAADDDAFVLGDTGVFAWLLSSEVLWHLRGKRQPFGRISLLERALKHTSARKREQWKSIRGRTCLSVRF